MTRCHQLGREAAQIDAIDIAMSRADPGLQHSTHQQMSKIVAKLRDVMLQFTKVPKNIKQQNWTATPSSMDNKIRLVVT